MKKQKIESIKNNKGITLLALIITVIVMLILVSVTVATTINDGRVYANGVWYDDIDAYIEKKPSENQT